jgi:alpha-D-xyloside xylohydrolase
MHKEGFPLHHFRFLRLPDSVLIETAEGLIKLTPYSAEIVRVRYTLERIFSPQASLMIVPQAPAPVDFTVRETEHSLSVSTAALSIQINKQTAALSYLDSSGTRTIIYDGARIVIDV